MFNHYHYHSNDIYIILSLFLILQVIIWLSVFQGVSTMVWNLTTIILIPRSEQKN
jgi:hypothetical protein